MGSVSQSLSPGSHTPPPYTPPPPPDLQGCSDGRWKRPKVVVYAGDSETHRVPVGVPDPGGWGPVQHRRFSLRHQVAQPLPQDLRVSWWDSTRPPSSPGHPFQSSRTPSKSGNPILGGGSTPMPGQASSMLFAVS